VDELDEQPLPGGNAGGAVLAGGTVRRTAGPWTPAVHALLRHLEDRGFAGAPRVIGLDEQGREVLTYLPGETVGMTRPWPAWVHSDETLDQVGRWLRGYHDAVRDFVPPPEARWRLSRRPWQPGYVVGHNDPAPYNAVWQRGAGPGDEGRLVGFFDWDFAAPCEPVWDLAFVVFCWVPFHARDVMKAQGFTAVADRPRRLRLLLDAYGYEGAISDILVAVRSRISDIATSLRELAAAGDPLFARLVREGVVDGLDRAVAELPDSVESFENLRLAE